MDPILSYNYDDEPVTTLNESKRAQQIRQKALQLNQYNPHTYVISLTDWHDDFEPNTQAKQNKGSVWVHSVTIGSPRHLTKARYNTCVLAIGPKGSSHENVLKRFYDELSTLSKSPSYFYHGKLKKIIFC